MICDAFSLKVWSHSLFKLEWEVVSHFPQIKSHFMTTNPQNFSSPRAQRSKYGEHLLPGYLGLTFRVFVDFSPIL